MKSSSLPLWSAKIISLFSGPEALGLTAEELHQRVDSGEASAAVYLNGSVFEQYGKAVF